MQGHHWSESKQKWVAFADMADNHVLNAWKKLGARYYEPDLDEPEQAEIAGKVAELGAELELRGWQRGEDGSWERPPVGEVKP